jgi:hypothetical protein
MRLASILIKRQRLILLRDENLLKIITRDPTQPLAFEEDGEKFYFQGEARQCS